MGVDPISIAMGVGSLVSAYGTYAAGQFAAAQSDQQAEIGKVRADQIDADYRDELNSTINNIRAVRAATGTGFDSPTGRAIERKNRKTSNRDRSRAVAGERIQSNMDAADARFRRSAAGFAFAGKAAQSLPYFFGQ